DAMHMDKSRLNEAVFSNSLNRWINNEPMEASYESEDWKRFFLSYYVESAHLKSISPKEDNIFKMNIRIKFNKGEDGAIRDRFLSVYERRLQKSKYDCKDVINRYGDIHFLDDYPFVLEDPDSLKEKIPAKLLSVFDGGSDLLQRKEKPPKVSFIGRDEDVNKLKELITSNRRRLVTIRGAPGIGKSDLSHAIMEELKFTFRDGCMNKKNLLLTLDNFEDPLNDRSPVIDFMKRLINNNVQSQIILTSREPLNDSSIETIYTLEKLDRKYSKKLLRELAKAQDCKEEISEKDADEILEELGDTPLAIVLFTPYLKYGIPNMKENLKSQGVDALKIPGIDDDRTSKNQSLKKSLSLSYMTIKDTGADRLFQVCSLFPVGIREDEAGKILPQNTIHDFITLEAKSLLYRDKTGRYSMLSPISSYAFKMLDVNPVKNAIYKKWIALCVEKSEDYYNTVRGRGSKDIKDLVFVLPNIFKALDFLMKTSPDIVEEKDNLFKIINNITDFMRFQGIHQDAKRYLSKAKIIAKKDKDIYREANCIKSLGDIHFRESRNDEARKSFEEALPLYRKVGAVLGEANCIKGFGKVLIGKGEFSEGRRQFDDAIKIYKKIKDRYSEALCLWELGLKSEDKSESKKLLIEASMIFEAINLPVYADRCKKDVR
ncbi:MAG: ATP-binding protein, partial [Nitrospinae bacterium]|nr:ATP-binding protein [Nitrospinota bacterium]